MRHVWVEKSHARGEFNVIVFSKRFIHCNKLEIFFPNLKVVIADFFKPGFFVKIDCPLVAVEHGQPDFLKVQFLGFFQQRILQFKSNSH